MVYLTGCNPDMGKKRSDKEKKENKERKKDSVHLEEAASQREE